MTELETNLLRKILGLGRKIESNPSPISPEILAEILALVSAFESSSEVGLQKIAELADGLHPDISPEKFSHFMVPLERMLDRAAKDSDFLITDNDLQTEPKALVPLVAVLDHLRSNFNVGSIFRAADAFGISRLHLVGYTATPEDTGLSKTALGAEDTVPWSRWKNIEECFESLRNDGYSLVALETSPSSISIHDFQFPERTALVLGNERFGLNYSVVEKCDHMISIPMRGTKNSLNVVSAFAIAGYEWGRQWTRV